MTKKENNEIVQFQQLGEIPLRFTGICYIVDQKETRYYLKGNLHRENGPASIVSDYREEWWYKGRRHRINGPAIIFQNTTNNINFETFYYYVHGTFYLEEEFWKNPLVINHKLKSILE